MTRKAAKRNPVARALRLLGRRVKPSGKLYRRSRARLTGLVLMLALLPLPTAATEFLTPYTLTGAGLLAICEHPQDCRWQYIFGVIETLRTPPHMKATSCANLAPDGCPDMVVGWDDAMGFTRRNEVPWMFNELCVASALNNPKLAAAEVRMVILYLKSHPEGLTRSAVNVIVAAIEWGFECPGEVRS